MGANGTFSKGMVITEGERGYKTIFSFSDNVVVIQKYGKAAKLPEESHTAGRIYVVFKKDGSDVKGIAKYGGDHKKVWEIHTTDHKGLGAHFHYWKDGKPVKDANPLTPGMKSLLNKIRNFTK
ncbi:MAG: hypothetical protein J6K19_00180 [Prevotella sp.]|nr:hypothetical protein [Prevotella sp.]